MDCLQESQPKDSRCEGKVVGPLSWVGGATMMELFVMFEIGCTSDFCFVNKSADIPYFGWFVSHSTAELNELNDF
jgi:hypothetical protein